MHDLKIWDNIVDLRIRLPGETIIMTNNSLQEVVTIPEPNPLLPAERRGIGSISRSKLRHFLIELAQKDNVGIIFDRQTLGFECCDNATNAVSVLAQNSAGGQFRLGCDLLVGADGSRSMVRKALLALHHQPDILHVEDGPGADILIRGRGADESCVAFHSLRSGT